MRIPILGRLLRRAIAPFTRNRRLALFTEQAFWWIWIRTGGWKSPGALRQLLDPARPLSPALAAYLQQIPSDVVRVLDVGAGPVTAIGYTMPGKQVEITAVDVLADQYDRMLHRRGIVPPVRTVYADAERLTESFAAGSFDVVVALNSIDHTSRPVVAIDQMVEVAKPGGLIRLVHSVDEGQEQAYAGLHQWNLTDENGRFIVWNRSERVDVSDRLAGRCEVSARRENGTLIVEIRKRERAVA
jgi:SAM-dependent methyltransferase